MYSISFYYAAWEWEGYNGKELPVISTTTPNIEHGQRLHCEYRQDAQLSQRDRAAACVIVFAKSRRLELGDNIYGHYRSIFNHCDIIGLKICRIP